MNASMAWPLKLLVTGLSLSLVSCLNSPQYTSHGFPPSNKFASSGSSDATLLGEDEEHCTWVASTASVPFGDQDTKHQALSRAVMDARSKAMNRMLGTKLEQRYVDIEMANSMKGDAMLTERVLRATQLGRTIKEKIVQAGLVDVGECAGCLYQASIETCIAPDPENHDKDFSVWVRLNRSHFINGDEVIISVSASRDAYLYIYGVNMEFSAEQIVPNQYLPSIRSRAGEVWTYPSDDLRAKGVRATARLATDSAISAEMIRVIATASPIPSSITMTRTGSTTKQVSTTSSSYGTSSFQDLVRALIASGIDWAEDARAFTITKE